MSGEKGTILGAHTQVGSSQCQGHIAHNSGVYQRVSSSEQVFELFEDSVKS